MLGNAENLELIFSTGNYLAMFAWIILIFLPRSIRLLNLIPSLVIPLLLSLAYGAIIMTSLSQGNGGDFSSLANVKQLFTSDTAVLAGWFHYLAFDLFIGGVIAKKADDIGISRFIQAPILFLTFMLGPIGLFLFYCTYGGLNYFGKNREQS